MTTFIYTGNDKTLLNRYKEDSKDFFEIGYNLILNTQIGATIGTHAERGMVGIARFKKYRVKNKVSSYELPFSLIKRKAFYILIR